MSKFRYGRLAAVASSALLALMLLGPTAVSAATPGWSLSNTSSLNPPLVKVGANAAWRVEIDNNGTSNISALFLSTDSAAGNPTYIGSTTYTYPANVAPGPANPCNPVGSGPLLCSFGNLPAGGKIVIDVVAFQVPSAATPSWSFFFTAFGNGNTPSDKGNNSHGDTLKFQVSVPTTADGNYGGGFSIDTNPVSNDPLSKNNPQSEIVTPPTNLIQVTIQDALLCVDPWCSTGFGDVMRLNVNKGATFTNGIKLVITISGKSVPGGATTSNIDLIHLLDNGSTQTVSQRCDGTTTLDAVTGGAECITVTKVGNNFQIVAYLASNGQIRLF